MSDLGPAATTPTEPAPPPGTRAAKGGGNRRIILVIAAAVVVLAGMGTAFAVADRDDDSPSDDEEVRELTATQTPTPDAAPPTREPAPSLPEPDTTLVLLDPAGGIDSFDRGAPADEVIAYLTERLGEPFVVSADTGCGPAGVPGQILRWGGMDVAFFTVDEVDLTTPTPAYLASWMLMDPAGDAQTTSGLAPGGTVAQLRAAHPELSGEEWMSPTVWLWNDGTWSSESMMVITTGGADTDTISQLSGGYACGE